MLARLFYIRHETTRADWWRGFIELSLVRVDVLLFSITFAVFRWMGWRSWTELLTVPVSIAIILSVYTLHAIVLSSGVLCHGPVRRFESHVSFLGGGIVSCWTVAYLTSSISLDRETFKKESGEVEIEHLQSRIWPEDGYRQT